MTKHATRIYLDYAAGTPVDGSVVDAMRRYQDGNFAHPSSLHAMGREASQAREDARFRIARMIEARSDECHFTSGATDGMTKAIHGHINALREKGVADRDMHVVMSVIEHANVRACVEGLSRRGIPMSVVGVTKDGVIDPAQLTNALRPQTTLVITMLVNNELGTIQPVREIRRMLDAAHSHATLLCDASQATLSLEVDVQRLAADMLVIDAHKFYGPLATGLLYVRNGTPFIGLCGAPGKPSGEGTPDIGAILGMAEALDITRARRGTDIERWQGLKAYCVARLRERVPSMRVHGEVGISVPQILNVSFDGLEGEFAVAQLDHAGIAVSAKSACLSGGGEGSYVVQAVDPDRANNSIRISFGRETTHDDIDVLVSALADIVPKQ